MGVEHESAGLRAAYRADTAPSVRNRFAIAMLMFAVFMGVGTAVEARVYPPRAAATYLAWMVEVTIGGLAALLASLRPLRDRPRWIAIGASATVLGVICAYHGVVGASVERLVMMLGTILNLLAVVVPWSWPAQSVLALATVGSFSLAAPFAHSTEAMAFPLVILGAAAITSVCAALFLDRYRFEAFRRTALQTEEAEIAAALAHVTERLSRGLGQEGLLDDVNRLAAEALGCDFSSLYLLDARRNVYALASVVGGSAEIATELRALEFAPDSLPLFSCFRPGALVEIPDTADQELVPPALMARLQAASVLYAPISRGDAIIGALVVGYTERRGPFSRRQRRLALGIAHATAVAIENTRLVADLQAANHLKSEFVATMSHELRTPLNVIVGYTHMLADGLARGEHVAFREALERIERSALALLELVSATLDLGRLESGHEAVAASPVDLPALFAGLDAELAPLVPDGVVLRWKAERDPWRVLTDAPKLKTVLKNLVGNALKFTDAGSVEVSARGREGKLVIAVRDTGIGIEAEQLPVIFEMFHQVDGSNTRRYGGVGLGLHISRRLVQLLGGSIAVESTPGVGSTFTVVLPLRPATAAVPPPAVA